MAIQAMAGTMVQVVFYSLVVVWVVLVCITLRFLLARRYTCLWMWLMVTTCVELVYLVALGQGPVPWYATRTVLFFHYTLTLLTLWFLGATGLQIREWFRGTCLFTCTWMILFSLLLALYLFPHEQPPDMVIHMSDSLLIYGAMVTSVVLVLVRIQLTAQWVVLGCLLLSILVSVLPLLWENSQQTYGLDRLIPATRCFLAWIALYIAVWIQARHFPWAWKGQNQEGPRRSGRAYHRLPVQSPEESDEGQSFLHRNTKKSHPEEVETSWDMQQLLYSHDAERLNATTIGFHPGDSKQRPEMDKRIMGLKSLWKRDPTRSICLPLSVLRLSLCPLSVVHLFYVPMDAVPALLQTELKAIYRRNVASAAAEPWFTTETFRKAIHDTPTVEWQVFVSQAFDAFHDHFNSGESTVPLHVLEWLLIHIHLVHSHGMASPPSSFPLRLSDYIQTAQYITDSLIRGPGGVIRHLNDTLVEWAGRDTLLATGSTSSPSPLVLKTRIQDAESFVREIGQCSTLHTVTALYMDLIGTSPHWILPLLGHIETKIKERANGTALWHRLQIPTSASFTIHPWYPLFRWFCAKYRRGVLNENITGLEHREIDSTLEHVSFELTERLEALHGSDRSGTAEGEGGSEPSPALLGRGLESSSPMFPSRETSGLSRDEQRSWMYPIPYSRISGIREPLWGDESVFVLDQAPTQDHDRDRLQREWLKEFGLWACWIWRAVLHTDFSLWRTETILHLHARSLHGESRSQHLGSILAWVEQLRADTAMRLSIDKVLHSPVFAPAGSHERSMAFAQESALCMQEICSFVLQRQMSRHAPSCLHESEAQKLHRFILTQIRGRASVLKCSPDLMLRDLCERLASALEMLMGTYNIQSHWTPSAVSSLSLDLLSMGQGLLLNLEDEEGEEDEPDNKHGLQGNKKETRFSHELFLHALERMTVVSGAKKESKSMMTTNVAVAAFSIQNLCESIRSDLDRRIVRLSALALDVQFLSILFCAWFAELESGLSLYMLIQGWVSVACETHIQRRASAFHRLSTMAFPSALMQDDASRRSSVLDFNRLKLMAYQQANQRAEVPTYVANPWVIPLQAVRPALISSAGSSAPASGRVSPQLDQDEEIRDALGRGHESEDEEDMP